MVNSLPLHEIVALSDIAWIESIYRQLEALECLYRSTALIFLLRWREDFNLYLKNTTMKEDHLRNSPVKFRKNPGNSFWREVFLKEEFTDARTHGRMDAYTHDRHNAMTIARWPSASGAKKLKVDQIMKYVLNRIKNNLLIGENAGQHNFFLFFPLFSKA